MLYGGFFYCLMGRVVFGYWLVLGSGVVIDLLIERVSDKFQWVGGVLVVVVVIVGVVIDGLGEVVKNNCQDYDFYFVDGCQVYIQVIDIVQYYLVEVVDGDY